MQAMAPTLYFILIAALWGLTFPLIEHSMKNQDPFLFVALRFTFAALILLPFSFKKRKPETKVKNKKEIILAGFILGIFNFVAFVSQTAGMQTINASRAAFITGANVIILSFLAPFFKLQKFKIADIFCGMLCFFGIYLITGADTSKVAIGDFLVLICAFFVALTIIYTSYLSKNNVDPLGLTNSQIIATAIFSWIPCLLFCEIDWKGILDLTFISILLYCGIFATIVCFLLQIKYQKYISAQKAGLLLCLEPIFAGFFDWLINQRELTWHIFAGGALILLSIAILEIQNQKQAVATSN